MRRISIGAAAAVVLAGTAFAGPVATSSAQACTGYTVPTLNPTSGPPGTAVTISAGADTSGCVPTPVLAEGFDVFVTIGTASQTPYASALATAQVNPDGSWSTVWNVPGGQPLGATQLFATVWGDYMNVSPGLASGSEWVALDYPALNFNVTGSVTTTASSVVTTSTTVASTSTTSVGSTSTTAGGSTSTTVAPPNCWVSDATLLPSEQFTIFGVGFAPGTKVEFWMESTPILLGTAVASAVGEVSAAYAVPVGMATGSHTVRLVGTAVGGGVLNLTTGVTVGAAAGATTTTTRAPSTGTLPRTGASPVPLAATGLALVALGAGVLELRRRHAL